VILKKDYRSGDVRPLQDHHWYLNFGGQSAAMGTSYGSIDDAGQQ
jgi:hypothetical protein